jgi:hypothetical protein
MLGLKGGRNSSRMSTVVQLASPVDVSTKRRLTTQHWRALGAGWKEGVSSSHTSAGRQGEQALGTIAIAKWALGKFLVLPHVIHVSHVPEHAVSSLVHTKPSI